MKGCTAPEDYFAPVVGSVALEPTGSGDTSRLVARGTGSVDTSSALAGRPAEGVLDVSARLWVGGWSAIRRVPSPVGSQPSATLTTTGEGERQLRAYATDKGNLSLEVKERVATPLA